MKYMDYQDYLIMPEYSSEFKSRKEVKLENEFGHIPIAAANMYGVGTLSMAIELQKHKMLTFLNKDIIVNNNLFDLPYEILNQINFNYVVPTFGITEKDFYHFNIFSKKIPNVKYICIDVANGHMTSVISMYKKMQSILPDVKFIVGNIANPATLVIYNSVGIYMAKVGVGSGSACSTRIQTGVGVPQATLTKQMYEVKKSCDLHIKIMSDGGIKQIGDISKAFILGADYVMMGSMFSGYNESGIEPIDGKINFKGSSFGQTKDYVADEGISVNVEHKGPVENKVKEILGGLRSAGSYINCNLNEFNQQEHLLIKVNRQKNDILDGRSF